MSDDGRAMSGRSMLALVISGGVAGTLPRPGKRMGEARPKGTRAVKPSPATTARRQRSL